MGRIQIQGAISLVVISGALYLLSTHPDPVVTSVAGTAIGGVVAFWLPSPLQGGGDK